MTWVLLGLLLLLTDMSRALFDSYLQIAANVVGRVGLCQVGQRLNCHAATTAALYNMSRPTINGASRHAHWLQGADRLRDMILELSVLTGYQRDILTCHTGTCAAVDTAPVNV